MKRTSTSILFLFLSTLALAGEPNQQILDYIDRYKAIAVQEMIEYRIPASITMAQGIIESGAGNSQLAKESNNHFGIKCHTDWKGERVYHDDDEKGECFRKYDDVSESYRDHSVFLATKPRYASLFELEPDDYKAWAKGLKAAGYATNPQYADMLINMIEEYKLYALDNMTLADVKKAVKENDVHKKDSDLEMETARQRKPAKEEKRVYNWNGYSGEVYYFNRIPTITADAKDSPESVAKEHNIKLSLLKDYNDIEQGGVFEPGTKIYLQPKRKKGAEKTYIVKSGETMWSISRDAGVRLSYLYKYNCMQPGQEPAAGEELNLRTKRREPVQVAVKQKITPLKQAPVQEQPKGQQEFRDTNNDIYIDFEDEAPAPQPVQEKPQEEQKHMQQMPVVAKPAETPSSPPASGEILIEQYHMVEPRETLYGISQKYQVTVEQIQKWNNLADTNIQIGQRLIVGYK